MLGIVDFWQGDAIQLLRYFDWSLMCCTLIGSVVCSGCYVVRLLTGSILNGSQTLVAKVLLCSY